MASASGERAGVGADAATTGVTAWSIIADGIAAGIAVGVAAGIAAGAADAGATIVGEGIAGATATGVGVVGGGGVCSMIWWRRAWSRPSRYATPISAAMSATVNAIATGLLTCTTQDERHPP